METTNGIDLIMENFDNLKSMLEEEKDWPLEYLFKFILKSGRKEDLHKIRSFFKNNVDIGLRESSKGNYQSVSIKAMMDSPDEIIEVYKKASEIDGLMVI